MPSYNIDGYSVRMWSSRSTTNLSPNTAVAGIYLYEGNTYRGYVYFYPDGTELAPPVFHSSNGRAFVHFNLSQFDGTLQVLQSEKPVYLYYFSPTNAGLNTGREPVGEQEG